MHLLKKNNKIMPWKNGGGSTSEIVVYPPGSSIEKGDFLWRLSSAKVEVDGPFSSFPDYDRFLTILTGDGIVLEQKQKIKELKKGEVFFFPGEITTNCKLLNGTITDLNFIFRRDKIKATFEIYYSPQTILLQDSILLFCNGPSLQIQPHNITLSQGDAWRNEDKTTIHISCEGTKMCFTAIEIQNL